MAATCLAPTGAGSPGGRPTLHHAEVSSSAFPVRYREEQDRAELHSLPPEFDGPEDTLSDFERFIDGLATYPETGVSLGQLSTRRTGPGGAIPKSLNHFRAASLGSVTCQIAPLGVNN